MPHCCTHCLHSFQKLPYRFPFKLFQERDGSFLERCRTRPQSKKSESGFTFFTHLVKWRHGADCHTVQDFLCWGRPFPTFVADLANGRLLSFVEENRTDLVRYVAMLHHHDLHAPYANKDRYPARCVRTDEIPPVFIEQETSFPHLLNRFDEPMDWPAVRECEKATKAALCARQTVLEKTRYLHFVLGSLRQNRLLYQENALVRGSRNPRQSSCHLYCSLLQLCVHEILLAD